jgi:hypothetical protein
MCSRIPHEQTADLAGFVQTILAEVLLCTKEVNEKARSSAFDLLATIAEVARDSGSELTLDQFATTVAAGLAGKTAHMISSAVLALAKLIYQVCCCRVCLLFVARLCSSLLLLPIVARSPSCGP